MTKPSKRCSWCGDDPIYVDYHDNVWGRPVSSKTELFAKLCLDGQQAGLSWITILKKQPHYEKGFYNFDPHKIVRYVPRKFDQLMQDKGIVRNKLKIAAFTKNAIAYLAILEGGQTFNDFLWQFTGHKTIQNNWQTMADVPVSTPESEAMSKALKKAGFTYVGPTICYAFMQAAGMVNDHTTDCFRHKELQ